MATVTGLTAARMLEIEAASVVDGNVVGDNLILMRHDTSTIDAGVVRGADGADGPPGEDGAAGADGPQGPPGLAPPRDDVNHVTGSLADDAGESDTIDIGLSYRILKIEVDRGCRVRLYTTAAKRDADITRLVTVDPSGDHGCVAEWIFDSAGSVDCAPGIIGSSLEAVPVIAIPVRVENLSGSTSTVDITLTYQELET